MKRIAKNQTITPNGYHSNNTEYTVVPDKANA